MDVDVPEDKALATSKSGDTASEKEVPRFEVKKWNAVALWAWDIVVDNCAICRNHIMDLWYGDELSDTCHMLTSLASSVKQIKQVPRARNAR